MMEDLLQSQTAKAGEIVQLVSNYKKDSADRKTKMYLETKITNLKKLYNEYVNGDNEVRNFKPSLELTHQYYKDRQSILEIYSKNIEDMRQRLNQTSLPSTPKVDSIQTSKFSYNEPEGSSKNDQDSEAASSGKPTQGQCSDSSRDEANTRPTKLTQQLKQQNIKMRGLYREIRAAEDVLASNNKSSTVLNHKLKTMERIMMQIMDLHEQICIEASEEQEANINYFVDQHYENLSDKYEEIVITITTLLEDNKQISTAKPLEIRLPRIEIPHFHGECMKWISFADTFKRLVHDNTQLTKTHKMNYLKSHIQGSAGKLLNHLETTGENYDAAWGILENRYNNRRLLVSNLLNTLLNQQVCSTESAAAIKSLHDITTECLYAIRNTGIKIDQWSPFIIFTLLKKLDTESRRLYESSLDNPREFQETSQFLTFLERRFQSLEAVGTTKLVPPQQTRFQAQPLKRAFLAATQTNHICIGCQKNHRIDMCPRFKTMTTSERNQMVMLHKLCRICLDQNHATTGCKSKTTCYTCQGNHHTLLHVQNREQENNYTKLNISTLDNDSDPVLLATALVRVQNIYGSSNMLRALIDPGSQATFITEEAAQELGLPRTRVLAEVSGISTTKGKSHQQIKINISPRFPSIFKIQTNALVLRTITKPLPDKNILGLDGELQKEIILADPTFDTPGPIDILIGADIYGEIMLEGIKRDPQHKCIAQKTQIGWIISGRLTQASNIPTTRLNSYVTLADIDNQLKRFWQYEELNPKRTLTANEIECEEHYKKTHNRLENGRYEVHIPLKNEKLKEIGIGESKGKAAARLLQIEKRFKKDDSFKKEYHKFINEYIQLNHMELVKNEYGSDPCRVYYMPHHAVLKEDSTTTKLRVVFDASCKTTTGTSINEMMHVGPTLQDNLTTILIRWKKHRYVIAADIEKMFRQIQVVSQDQDFQRILWRTNPNMPMRCYRLKTVTYGTASATYLATKTLQQLAIDEVPKYPIGSKLALNDFYVDDLLSGANTITEARIAQRELQELLSTGGFNLRKWASNNKTILEDLPEKFKETGLHTIEFDETIKTLGILWNSTKDTFQFKVSLQEIKSALSKRIILSEASRLFDPLGWLAPVVVQAKILLQDLWASGVGWDEKLNSKFDNRWSTYKQELPQLEQIRINRWTHYTTQSKIELHGFCDASNQAYAAVVYSKVNNKITLIAAKTRVAPLNQTISLPRLELNAALLLSRLLQNVSQALDINNNITTFCWSDSTAVLGWIKGKPQNHKTFVANRITEIQSITNPSQWYHVVSNENPADCASRGLNPVQLLSHEIWWEGPAWLKGLCYPTTNIDTQEMEQAGSMESKSIRTLTATVENRVIEFSRFSSIQRLIHTVAYCLRFPSNIKLNTRNVSHFAPEELNISLRAIIRIAQRESFGTEIKRLEANQNLQKGSAIITLTPFIDENGVLRVGGRLSNSSLPYEEKHPIILPRGHKLSKLIIRDAHLKTLHGGNQATLSHLRTQYWIINAKTTIRKYIHECIICIRSRKLASTQLMGILPKERVNPAPPFTNSGVDYAGPISIKLWKGRCNKTSKGYIAIFICLAIKAIHLELVSDLSTDAFLAAYKRFVSRRGICSNIFSDCGTNFVGADKELKRQAKQQEAEIKSKTAQMGTTWHFVPPGSPHFGGLWEAGVKSTKQRLRKIIGTHTLTFEELSTVLTQIEACLNSRPLAPLSDDPEDDGFLSPAHFLIGRPMIAMPQRDIDDIHVTTRWNLLTKLSQGFWKKWHTEYLSRLQHRSKWLLEQPNLRVGELVILKDEHLPPTHWPLARVVELHPGQDGLVRVVSVRYKDNTFKRNITKVCRLPVTNSPEDHMNIIHQAKDCVHAPTMMDGNKTQQQTKKGSEGGISDNTITPEVNPKPTDTRQPNTKKDNQNLRRQPYRHAKSGTRADVS